MKKFSPDAEILNSIIRVGFTRNLILFLVFLRKIILFQFKKYFFLILKKILIFLGS